jgi:cobaltochelatase CobN
VDRQGSHRFSDADRQNLVRLYVESVARFGVSCSANTCGNLRLHQHIGEQSALIEGLGQEPLRRFGQRLSRATGWNGRQFAGAPPAMTSGMRTPAQPAPPPPVAAERAAPPTVSGFRLEEVAPQRAVAMPLPLTPWPFIAAGLVIAAGMLREARRHRQRPAA